MAVSDMEKAKIMVVDAQGHIAGRLSSYIAKSLLKGNKVVVVNAEKTLLSGRKSSIINQYLKRLEIGSVINPRHGPLHPRRPDTMLTKMVRGMLPYRKAKGLEALKRLRVYISIPEQYNSVEKAVFEKALATKPLSFYLTLGDVASRLGWKGK
ncbi:MAG: 50S ribosomal protein L13 [Candidatus Methylarchaceae archaeon HK01B]|nr:50S ribosomal protein L13 [Candidatus Methylarchaceae archaeon HK01M]MCP8312475.1 50S ribosomal protein L13 [Candidatus Methylarchaceae archaeon HK02M1]MCP8319098.1 50S ribosomal protein L13 [Candidatus Methylarchaceae archaeon HK01B]